MAYGSIMQTTNGKFRVCFDYGQDMNGKRVRKYQVYDSKTEAKKALNQHKVKMDEGTFVLPKNITLEEWLKYWIEQIMTPKIAATTLYGYQKIINGYLIPNLGALKLQKLRPKEIQEYYSKVMEQGLSPNTVLKHHNLLISVLKAAYKYEYIAKNPMEAVEPPRKIKTEAKFYTPEQLGALLNKAAGTRLELPIRICGHTGIRRGELCGLRWRDINFQNRVIDICNTRTQVGAQYIEKDTKTESSNRKLHIPSPLYDLLQKEKERQEQRKAELGDLYIDSDYVVVMDDGKPYRPNYLSELFTKFLADNGLPKIVLHELRHTFASISNEAGVQDFNIGKALGHSTPGTTKKIYTHVLEPKHTAAIESVAAIIEAAVGKSKRP